MYKKGIVLLLTVLIFTSIFLVMWTSLIQGEEMILAREDFIASATEEKVLPLGLVDCITFALKNNSEIKIEKIEPKIKEDELKIAQAEFEPELSFDYELEDQRLQPTSSLVARADRNKSRVIDFNSGLSGKLWTGTEYNVEFLNTRDKANTAFRSFSRFYTSEGKATITQPLLKGFGLLVNRADILISRNNQLASLEDFKQMVMNVLTDTKTTYLRYVLAMESYYIAELSLKRAQDLLAINKKRYEAGLISSVDLLENETALAQREKALIAAESELKKKEDELKLITNLIDDPQLWNARIEPLDRPKLEIKKVDLAENLKIAFEKRPDYESSSLDLKNKNIEIKKAKNSLFPQLDLEGSYSLNGYGKDWSDDMDKFSGHNRIWGLEANFSMPLGLSEARADYDLKKLEKMQTLLAFKRLEQKIILEVRDAAREVDIQYRQVLAATKRKEAEGKNYAGQKEKYAAGEVSTHDMLDYQEKLSEAELGYIESLINYEIALIDLDKTVGLTLERNNVTIEP